MDRSLESTRSSRVARRRSAAASALDRYLERGFAKRHFFPHSVRFVRKAGADGQVLAEAMYGEVEPGRLRQAVLHAEGPSLDGLPAEVFFDRDLVWHQQHLGIPGHVAAANLIVGGDELLTTARYSDVVQRLSRRRDLSTRLEKRFRGWDHMLLNAVFGYAVEHDLSRIRFPTAELALENTDRSRNPKPPLYERIYDHDINRRFTAVREGRFWVVDVVANMDRWVPLDREEDALPGGPAVCLCHDTERGFGHVSVDDDFAAVAERESARSLERFLECEARADVRGTYAVVGCMLGTVRDAIESAGHEVAFHSYDHDLTAKQLLRCRQVDYRVPGYRPPRSVITEELTDRELARRNFEWIASAPKSLGVKQPELGPSFVKIPVAFDDFAFYRLNETWASWKRRAVEQLDGRDVAVVGVHDCYGHLWLERYPELLSLLKDRARVVTIGQIANEVFLEGAE